MAAWRAVPAMRTLTTPLTKIIQGAQETYARFVARLQEAAERIVGQSESEGLLVRQLALENANSACKAALRGKTRDLDISGMIRLCSDADSHIKVLSPLGWPLGLFQKSRDPGRPGEKHASDVAAWSPC